MLNIQAQYKLKCAHQQILYLSSIIIITKIFCMYLVTCVILVTIHTMSLKR